MAAEFAARLAAIAFTAATLRGAVCGEAAADCLPRAFACVAAAWPAGLVVGGLVGRLAAERAERDAADTATEAHGD